MTAVAPRNRSSSLRDDIDLAVHAATDWLLGRLAADGTPDGDVGHAYRVPYALLLAGRRPDAARVLTWMEREILSPDGDLQQGPMRDGFARRWSSYPLAIIAQTAWHLERYATATRVLETLAAFQDPDFGGAYAERPELRTSRRQDLFPTAQLGMTGLAVGDDAVADGAFRWLSRLYEMQPELPDRLYSATDGDQLLVDLGDDPSERFGLCTELRQPRQAFYNPGIAAAFLARYGARRGSREAQELADAYLALTIQGTPAQFDHQESVQVCKFGWGAASLLDLDARDLYREQAERMGRWFVDAQNPDGHWENSPFLLPDGPTVGSCIEITAEFTQHLIVISTALAGADGCP
jgi:hypothetical protein